MRESEQWMVEMQQLVKELQAEQKKTEKSLRAFIDSLRRGGNGHGGETG